MKICYIIQERDNMEVLRWKIDLSQNLDQTNGKQKDSNSIFQY